MQDILGVFVNIVNGLILSGIGIVLGLLYRNIRNYIKFNEFANVFGKVAKVQDNIILSVPLWELIEPDGGRDIPRFTKETFDHQKEEYYGPGETISYEDLKACVEIVSVISEVHSKPVKYTLDNDQKYKLKDKTIIMVGAPLANLRARSSFDSYPDVCFDYVDQKETDKHRAATAIRDKRDNKRIYDCSGEKEYSIVMRIQSRHAEDGYLFFVSGAHASGTLAAALYLKDNWQRFKHSEKVAGVLLEMTRGDHSDSKVVKEYGFKRRKRSIQSLESGL